MKTVRLVKLEDCSHMTEDGMFVVRYHVGMGSYPKGWSVCSLNDTKFVTYVTYAKALSSLRCARVWIKNFYRTMTFKKEKSPTQANWDAYNAEIKLSLDKSLLYRHRQYGKPSWVRTFADLSKYRAQLAAARANVKANKR